MLGFSVTAFAGAYSVTVKIGEPVSDVSYSFYLVMQNDKLTDDFKDCAVNTKHVEKCDKGTALTLHGYAAAEKINAAFTGKSDEKGNVKASLPEGIYLVVPGSYDKDGKTYTAAPFIMKVQPLLSGNEIKVKYGQEISKTEIVLSKVWLGADESKWKENVTVDVFTDGALFKTVILSAENMWKQTVSEIPAMAEIAIYEHKIPGYFSVINLEGNTYTIVNTAYDKSNSEYTSQVSTTTTTTKPDITLTTNPVSSSTPNSTEGSTSVRVTSSAVVSEQSSTANNNGDKLPQTGLLWWPVSLLAAFGLMFIAGGICIRKKGGENL